MPSLPRLDEGIPAQFTIHEQDCESPGWEDFFFLLQQV
jgi:hypothetical protein